VATTVKTTENSLACHYLEETFLTVQQFNAPNAMNWKFGCGVWLNFTLSDEVKSES
jgi:hypothetical protein